MTAASSGAPRRGRRERRQPPPEDGEEKLDRLRELLLGPEQTRLANIEQRFSAEAVGKLLPEAVASSQERDNALAWALRPAVVHSIRDTVERDPRLFVDAIAPSMGPAIRKAVSHALRSLLQQLNATLARGLSPRALLWRVEALRTGRPFAEIVLLRSLVYRVEQVFLVHAETALVLQHLVADGTPVQDPDQVAAMLSAIDAFARDAFREDARLAQFQVGDLSGWVEHGPRALVVAIVRGTAPSSLATVLRETEERIHLELRRELSAFQGDAEPFERARPILERCLVSEAAPSRTGSRFYAPVALLLVAIAAMVLGALAWDKKKSQEALHRTYLEALSAEPGVIVTKSDDEGGRFVFEGLRDPLADDPATILAARGLDAQRAVLRFSPFLSADPGIVERRAKSDPEAAGRRVRSLAADLTERRFFFALGHSDLLPDQRTELARSARDVLALLDAAHAAKATVMIEVLGHTDVSGAEAANQALSAARAQTVTSELVNEVALLAPTEELRDVLRPRGEGAAIEVNDPCDHARRRGAECARTANLRVWVRSE